MSKEARSDIRSILYVYLPLGGRSRIFPSGLAYLASYARRVEPSVRQQILDLSLSGRRDRGTALKKAVRDFRPDLIAFSWRHIRCFGPDLYNDDLKELEYGSKRGVGRAAAFLATGFGRWREYAACVRENIGHIASVCADVRRPRRQTSAAVRRPLVLVGGPAFSVFHKDLLKKLRPEVLGVVGEGEAVLADLLRGRPSWREMIVCRDAGLSAASAEKRRDRYLDVAKDVKAVDYAYIASVFPGHEKYFGGTIGVQTNRGCDQRCVYCPDTARERNTCASRCATDVADEIAGLQKAFKTDKVWFTDRLVVSRSNAGAFALVLEEILRRGLSIRWSGYMRSDAFTPELASLLVRSGLEDFIVPITSGSQRVADALKIGIGIEGALAGCRLLKEAGYRKTVKVELTLGVVEETVDDIRRSAAAYKEIQSIFGADRVRLTLNFCVVLPGSELEQQLFEAGYLSKDYDAVSLNPFTIRKFAYMAPSLRQAVKRAYARSYGQVDPAPKSREELVLEYLRAGMT